MPLDLEDLEILQRNSAAWRLLRAEHAPMILAFFMNTAIDQQLLLKEKKLGRKLDASEIAETKAWTMSMQ